MHQLCAHYIHANLVTVKSISYRKLKSIDTQCLKSDISESTLCSDPSIIQDHLTTGELDALVRRYQDTLTSVIDHHAPTKTRIIVARPKVPWYNEEIDKAKRARRKAERIWRRTRSLSDLKTFYVKPFYRAETPKLDREPCVAAHLFVEESLTMITKTDRDWLE